MEKSFNPEKIKKSEDERITGLSDKYKEDVKKARNRVEAILDKLDNYDFLNEVVSEEREKASFVDELTNIKNRKALNKIAPEILRVERRYNRKFSVLMVDIDHFKKLNDGLGHQAGDKILRDLPTVIGEIMRESDLLFRYGGEEFTILLPDTDTPGAIEIADKIRKGVEKKIFDLETVPEEAKKQKITLSIGIFSSEQLPKEDREKRPNEILDIMIGKADKALYKAKEEGRNQSVLFHESMENKK